MFKARFGLVVARRPAAAPPRLAVEPLKPAAAVEGLVKWDQINSSASNERETSLSPCTKSTRDNHQHPRSETGTDNQVRVCSANGRDTSNIHGWVGISYAPLRDIVGITMASIYNNARKYIHVW